MKKQAIAGGSGIWAALRGAARKAMPIADDVSRGVATAAPEAAAAGAAVPPSSLEKLVGGLGGRMYARAMDPNRRALYGALFGGGAGLSNAAASGDDSETTLMKMLGGAGGAASLVGLGNSRYKALLPYLKPLGLGAGVVGAGALAGNALADKPKSMYPQGFAPVA